MKQTPYEINIEFKPCNKLNPYLQWKHIAIWQFRLDLQLMMREAMKEILEKDR